MNPRVKELLILFFVYLVTVWLIATVVFLWWRVLPGDPAIIHAPRVPGDISDEFLESFSVFEKPLYEQYADYMARTLTGQFYYSISHDSPISSIIYEDLSWSLFLITFSLGVSLLIAGFSFKYLARPRRNDGIQPSDGISLLMFSVFPFALAVGLLQIANQSDFLPNGGNISMTYHSMSLGDKIVDALKHVILPMLSLAVFATGALILIFRTGGRRLLVQTVDDSGAVGRMKAPALSGSVRELMPPFHFLIAGLFGLLVAVEALFGYRGIGWTVFDARFHYDAFLLEACAFLIPAVALTFAVSIEAVTILVDPRVSGRATPSEAVREVRAAARGDQDLMSGLVRFAVRTLRRPGGLVGGLMLLLLIVAAVIGMTISEERYLSPFIDDYDIASATLRGAGIPVGVVLLVMLVSLPVAVAVGYMIAAVRRDMREAAFLVELPAKALSYCFIALGVVVPLISFSFVYYAGALEGGLSTGHLVRVAFVSSFCGLFLLCLAEGAKRFGAPADSSASRGVDRILKSRNFAAVAAHAFRGCKVIAPLTMLGVIAADCVVGYGWTSWGTVLRDLWFNSSFITDTWMVVPPAVGIAALVIGSYLLADSAEKVLSEHIGE